MKRRAFIAASVLSLLGLGAFSLLRWIRGSREDEVLVEPRFLSLLCDKDTIRMLGRAYLKLKPDETKEDILLSDLLPNESSRILLEKKNLAILESQIEKRIIQDFDSNNIVTVQGWVLSITEARQCALFSMHNA